MYEGDCNQAVVFLFTLNYLNVRNNEYGLEFFRQILKLEGLRGQKAAIVIRLFYEEERQKAKERMSLGGKGGNEEGSANLHTLEMGKDVAEILAKQPNRSEEHTSELQSRFDIVCRLLLEKKKTERCT